MLSSFWGEVYYTRQLPNSIPSRPLDYSDESIPSLFENAANENLGIRGVAKLITVYNKSTNSGKEGTKEFINSDQINVDFNGDGEIGNNISYLVEADVNYIPSVSKDCGKDMDTNNDRILDSAGLVELRGYDDWDNLKYNFIASPEFADGVHVADNELHELTVDEAATAARTTDFDQDGYMNAYDNCPGVYNPDQTDRDRDGKGDGCDDYMNKKGDFDNDGDVDSDDLNILLVDRDKTVANSACGLSCDLDGDYRITALDARKLTLLCTRPRCLTK